MRNAGAAAATDALVLASIATRERRPGSTIVRCPTTPNFWYGNVLVLNREPAPATYGDWVARHAELFAGVPVKRHVVTWEARAARDRPAAHAACEYAQSTVFVTRAAPRRESPLAFIRELAGEADWSACAERARRESIDAGRPEQAAFDIWRVGIYRADAHARRCRIWGAFIGDELVAYTGLYSSRDWARFITPITAPVYRRRGLFGALASVAIGETLRMFPTASIVVAAETGAYAESAFWKASRTTTHRWIKPVPLPPRRASKRWFSRTSCRRSGCRI